MKNIKFNHIIITLCFLYAVSVSERILNKPIETITKDAYVEEKRQYEQKIEHHERKIFEDSVDVWNSDRNKRDSLRAIYNPR